MATVNLSSRARLAPASRRAEGTVRLAPPQTLRLLALSFSASRRRLFAEAADAAAWEAILCREIGEFWRTSLRERADLTLVDLPSVDSPLYAGLQSVVADVQRRSDSLLAVVGLGDEREEIWARSTGSWLYLREACGRHPIELALRDAQVALQRIEVRRALSAGGVGR